MKKSEKIFLVEDLAARLKDAKSMVLVDITGLKVPDQQHLRQMLKSVGATISVVKNTLLKRALDNSTLKPRAAGPRAAEGSGEASIASGDARQTSNLESSLVGQTAIVISETNEVEPLQALGKFIKKLEMPKLKIGIISGKIYAETALVKISKLPGREVLAAQVVGSLASPLYNLVDTLQGNLVSLVYSLNEKIRMQSAK